MGIAPLSEMSGGGVVFFCPPPVGTIPKIPNVLDFAVQASTPRRRGPSALRAALVTSGAAVSLNSGLPNHLVEKAIVTLSYTGFPSLIFSPYSVIMEALGTEI